MWAFFFLRVANHKHDEWNCVAFLGFFRTAGENRIDVAVSISEGAGSSSNRVSQR